MTFPAFGLARLYRAELLASLAFLGLALIWGSTYFLIKIGTDQIGLLAVVGTRYAIGAAVVGAWMALQGRPSRLSISAGDVGRLIGLSVFNLALPLLAAGWAERTIPTGLAAMLAAIAPLFSALLAVLFAGERVTWLGGVGLAIGLIGVYVLIRPSLIVGNSLLLGGTLLADLAVVLGALCAAASAVYAKGLLARIGVGQLVFYQLAAAAFMCWLASLLFERAADTHLLTAIQAPHAFLPILAMGLLNSALAYPMFYLLLRWWGATRSMSLAYVMPVVAVALGSLFLNERITSTIVLGAAFVFCGVLLVNRYTGGSVSDSHHRDRRSPEVIPGTASI